MDTKVKIRFLVLLLLIPLFLGGGLIWWYDAISSANVQDKTNQIFVVQEGEGVRSIVTRLKNQGLIKNPIAFFLQLKLLGIDEKIQAGDFHLNSSMDAKSVAQALTHGSLDVWVTLLEGWRNEEIALKLAQELAIPEQEFLKIAREGYMFPDTYLFPKEASAAAIVRILENNFANHVTQEIKDGFKMQNMTIEDGIILASIVEREGKTEEDRPVISAILQNRLRSNYPLQADATLQYALGYQPDDRTWWKKTLYDEDKKVKSPYNTYLNLGLPPKPISNPGLSSVKAVANPPQTDYFYYLHDQNGEVHYAKTLAEHNENINKYLK